MVRLSAEIDSCDGGFMLGTKRRRAMVVMYCDQGRKSSEGDNGVWNTNQKKKKKKKKKNLRWRIDSNVGEFSVSRAAP
jgi:hypothetical protein